MNITGAGTGALDYQVNDEQAVENKTCTVTGAEDDGARSLVLTIGFTDANHGLVAVGITVSNFSAEVQTYSDIDTLHILTTLQGAAGGGWISQAGGSVYLYVTVTPGSESSKYDGAFHAADLLWTGSGQRDSLAIKFGSYALTMTAQQWTAPSWA